MGWYFTDGASRSDLIRELTQDRGVDDNGNRFSHCIRFCARGNVLWSVWKDQCGRWIGCDLMQRSDIGWGHKPMEESMGPCYWSCPLAYLAMVPVANQGWRNGVVEYHTLRKRKAAATRKSQKLLATNGGEP